jgi:molybdate transport system substrate-binding protein
MVMMTRLIAVMTFTAGMISQAGMSYAAEVKVMASAAFKEAYVELVPEFERTTGHKVVTIWTPTVEMMKRLKGGETVDLVIIAADSLDELIKLGKIATDSRVDIAKSGIGIAVRAGAPKPDVRTTEALKRTLLAAKSIAYSTGPSGVYIISLFQRMDIADELKPKIKQVQGVPIGELVARGDAEIGFQQVSEILPVAGIELLGPLPADIQRITIFSTGLHVGAQQPDAAKALVKFFTASAAVPVIRKKGMEPG